MMPTPWAAMDLKSSSMEVICCVEQPIWLMSPCQPYETEKTLGGLLVDRICCVHCFRSPQKSWPAYCHASVFTPGATPMMYCTSRLASTPSPCCWSPTYLYTLSCDACTPWMYDWKNCVRSDCDSSWPWNSAMAWRFARSPVAFTPLMPYAVVMTDGMTLTGAPALSSSGAVTLGTERGGRGRPWMPKTASTCSATEAGSVMGPARVAFWRVSALCTTVKVVSRSVESSAVVASMATDAPVGATVKATPAAVSHSETAATAAGSEVMRAISAAERYSV
mmetsp:Transcript_17488/g.61446  ORF Transcript_17488/g.61446 Transcript_17488/m.61446 type:complete len:278 (+) Transcript_17488:1117-1950(+)